MAIAWCDDGSGALKRYGLTTQELEILCCFEHQRANGSNLLGSWAVESERAISARRLIVALQRVEPPPDMLQGRRRLHAVLRAGTASTYINLRRATYKTEDADVRGLPQALLPGPVLDEKDEQAARMPWGAPQKSTSRTSPCSGTKLIRLWAPWRAARRRSCERRGFSCPVGGEFRRRLGDAIDNVVRVLQRHTRRRVTSITLRLSVWRRRGMLLFIAAGACRSSR